MWNLGLRCCTDSVHLINTSPFQSVPQTHHSQERVCGLTNPPSWGKEGGGAQADNQAHPALHNPTTPPLEGGLPCEHQGCQYLVVRGQGISPKMLPWGPFKEALEVRETLPLAWRKAPALLWGGHRLQDESLGPAATGAESCPPPMSLGEAPPDLYVLPPHRLPGLLCSELFPSVCPIHCSFVRPLSHQACPDRVLEQLQLDSDAATAGTQMATGTEPPCSHPASAPVHTQGPALRQRAHRCGGRLAPPSTARLLSAAPQPMTDGHPFTWGGPEHHKTIP